MKLFVVKLNANLGFTCTDIVSIHEDRAGAEYVVEQFSNHKKLFGVFDMDKIHMVATLHKSFPNAFLQIEEIELQQKFMDYEGRIIQSIDIDTYLD